MGGCSYFRSRQSQQDLSKPSTDALNEFTHVTTGWLVFEPFILTLSLIVKSMLSLHQRHPQMSRRESSAGLNHSVL